MTHFNDDQITELIAEAQQATFCRCYHESQEQECGIHGDAHSRLVGGLADALAQVKAERDDARDYADRGRGHRRNGGRRVQSVTPQPSKSRKQWDI